MEFREYIIEVTLFFTPVENYLPWKCWQRYLLRYSLYSFTDQKHHLFWTAYWWALSRNWYVLIILRLCWKEVSNRVFNFEVNVYKIRRNAILTGCFAVFLTLPCRADSNFSQVIWMSRLSIKLFWSSIFNLNILRNCHWFSRITMFVK